MTSLLKQTEKAQVDCTLKYENSMYKSRPINLKLLFSQYIGIRFSY